jgi:hypothetical protein
LLVQRHPQKRQAVFSVLCLILLGLCFLTLVTQCDEKRSFLTPCAKSGQRTPPPTVTIVKGNSLARSGKSAPKLEAQNAISQRTHLERERTGNEFLSIVDSSLSRMLGAGSVASF